MSEQLTQYNPNGDGSSETLPALPNQRKDTALSSAVQIESVDDVVRLGKMMAASGFFQDAKDTAKACVKILAGAELGISPVAAMRGVYVFDGNTTLNASLVGALIKRSGRYDYEVVKVTGKGAAIDFFEDGERSGRATFTMEDAKQAGLTGKRNWKNYPSDMCFARAMTRGARRYCSEVFLGPIYTPDEMGQETDRQGNPIDEPLRRDPEDVEKSARRAAKARAKQEEAPDRPISQKQIKRLYAIAKNEGGFTDQGLKRMVARKFGFDSLSDIPRGETYDRIADACADEGLAGKYNRDPDTKDMFDGEGEDAPDYDAVVTQLQRDVREAFGSQERYNAVVSGYVERMQDWPDKQKARANEALKETVAECKAEADAPEDAERSADPMGAVEAMQKGETALGSKTGSSSEPDEDEPDEDLDEMPDDHQ